MRRVTFLLEREDGFIRVLAKDLFGFFLFSDETERLMQSVIPLTQVLLYENEGFCGSPIAPFDPTRLLLIGAMTVQFKQVEQTEIPKLLIKGTLLTTPDGCTFYAPSIFIDGEERIEPKIHRLLVDIVKQN